MHGGTEQAVASIIFDENVDNYDYTQLENITGDYEIISSDEIEEYLKRKGE